MKKNGALLIAIGIIGIIFVSIFDIIMRKPVNDITGPKSIAALAVCIILIFSGLIVLLKKKKSK